MKKPPRRSQRPGAWVKAMTERENSTKDTKPKLDPLLEISELASRLQLEFRRDPSNREAYEAAVVLYAIADRKHNRLKEWYRQTVKLAAQDRTHIGPTVHKSLEADVLAKRLDVLMSHFDDQNKKRVPMSGLEVSENARAIARGAMRTLRTLPLLCAETSLPSSGPLSELEQRVDAVASVVERRAIMGRLDRETMAQAIMKALDCKPSVARNMYKHKG